jgi:hypothetical protein
LSINSLSETSGSKPSATRSCALLLAALAALAGAPPALAGARPERPQRPTGRDRRRPAEDSAAVPLPEVKEVRIVAGRNGTFCGCLPVGDLAGASASLTDLEPGGGGAAIPASGAEVLYAWGTGPLLASPPEGRPEVTRRRAPPVGAVWLRVAVPPDARPGEYRGKLTVNGKNGGRSVPVILKILDWQLPDPGEFRTMTDAYQSPESVAMQYEVPLWSEEHWKLLEESWKRLGEIGNKSVMVYALARCNYGNVETMIRWIKDEKVPGGYRHDFSVLDRYLALAVKYTRPRVTSILLWDYYLGGGGRYAKITATYQSNMKPVQFTVLDPASGKTTLAEGPWMDGPKYDAAKARAFWKPVLEGVMKLLAKHGLEKTAMLGWVGDGKPSEAASDLYKELLPGVPWTSNAHACQVDGNYHGVPVAYCTHVYKWRPPKAAPFWERPTTIFPRIGRHGLKLEETSPLYEFRHITEAVGVDWNAAGIGRIGADYFLLLKAGRHGGSRTSICGRFPESAGNQLNLQSALQSLFEPGPEGAIRTARSEAFLMGIQDCQARILVEEALAAGKPGGALGERCRKVLDARRELLVELVTKKWSSAAWVAANAGGRLDAELTEELYACAAEVARARGK